MMKDDDEEEEENTHTQINLILAIAYQNNSIFFFIYRRCAFLSWK